MQLRHSLDATTAVGGCSSRRGRCHRSSQHPLLPGASLPEHGCSIAGCGRFILIYPNTVAARVCRGRNTGRGIVPGRFQHRVLLVLASHLAGSSMCRGRNTAPGGFQHITLMVPACGCRDRSTARDRSTTASTIGAGRMSVGDNGLVQEEKRGRRSWLHPSALSLSRSASVWEGGL